MSHGHSDIYHKKEENISVILITFHKKGGKYLTGGKCHKYTLTIFQRDLEAWEEKLNGKKSDW